MSKSDGTIVFSTEMDNKELAKQVEEAKKEVKDIESQIDKLNKEKTSAVKAQAKAQEKLTKAQEEYNAALDKSIKAGEKAQAARAALQAAEEKQKQLVSDIGTSRDAQEKTRLSGELNSQMDAISQARAEWETAEAAAASYDGAVANAAQNVDAATASLRSAEGAVSGIDASLSSANTVLGEAEAKAGGLENQFKKAEARSKKLQKPIDKASDAVNKLGKRIARVAASALVFSTLYKAFGALKERLSDAVEQSEEASKAMAQLRGAVKTAAQPIVDALVPALTALAQALTRTIVLTGSLFGKDFIKDASDAAQALDNVKKARQSLAGFDEITTVGGDKKESNADYEFNDVVSGQTANAAKSLNKIIAEAALAVGAILTFSGTHILLGIAMMALGASAIVSEVKDDWTATENKVEGAVTGIETVLAGAMFVIGAVLLFSGHIPIGIAAILLGIEVTAVAVSFTALEDELQTPLGRLAGLMTGVTLVVIGIILCCAQQWPLGVGAIVAGASAFIGTVAINWNAIADALQNPITAALGVIGGLALAVFGVLLCCAQQWPLGLSLIAAGLAYIGGTIAVNWNAITDKVKEIWQSVKNFWNKYIAPIFTLAWWKNLAIKCGNGLIAGFEGTINGIIAMFEKMINWIVGGLNEISVDIPDWKIFGEYAGGKFGFNIDPVSFGRVSIPRLAQGAVIPANQEFLAVLGDQKHGTNVEAPLSTIQEAVRTELVAMFGNGLGTIDARLLAILDAIYGIDTSDERYARAVDNYNRREAIMGGV